MPSSSWSAGGVLAGVRERFRVAEPLGNGSFGHSWSAPGGDAAPAAARVLVVLQVEAVVDLGEHRAEVLDLVVGVRGGHLDPEPDLVLGDEGVRGERHVDAAVEEVAADGVDVLVAGERHLDHRVAGLVRRVDVELVEAVAGRGRSCGSIS